MAGAGRRVFQPGEVLTASNVMSYLQDQAVQVYAGTAARGSAIGTAVSEGMVSYLADANQLQFFESGSWRTFAATSGLPVANGGTGGTTVAQAQDNLRVGLVPISPSSVVVAGAGSSASANDLGKVTFSGCTSLSLNGIFSNNFSNYFVMASNLETNTGYNSLSFRLRNGGVDRTSANYFLWGFLYLQAGISAQGANATNSFFMNTNIAPPGAQTPTFFNISLYHPFNENIGTNVRYSSGGYNGVTQSIGEVSGSYNTENSNDGITFFPTSNSFSGVIQCFGYNE